MYKWKGRLKADPTSQLREEDNLSLYYWFLREILDQPAHALAAELPAYPERIKLLRQQKADGHQTKGRQLWKVAYE